MPQNDVVLRACPELQLGYSDDGILATKKHKSHKMKTRQKGDFNSGLLSLFVPLVLFVADLSSVLSVFHPCSSVAVFSSHLERRGDSVGGQERDLRVGFDDRAGVERELVPLADGRQQNRGLHQGKGVPDAHAGPPPNG